MEKTIESKYLLSDYITSEKKMIVVENMEYELTLFQGDHANEYLLCEMNDGKVEGRCQLFNRGILSLAWIIQNGKRVGGITKYESGKALEIQDWNSILGSGDRRIVENCKEGLIMTIRSKRENNENGGIIIYRGGFDEEMNRHGYGIEYNRENGKEKIEGYWMKDKLIQIIREFEADNNIMIEYVPKDNAEILNRIPIYVGGYCLENGKYVRNGKGYLIDEKSGIAIRESEWKHGEEKKDRTDLYEGWYVKGMKKSMRSVLKNENTREMKNASVATKKIEIKNTKQLNETNLDVTDLVISSNCCNDVLQVNLFSYQLLQSVTIGDDCFGSVKTFRIEGLNRLKTIKIGSNSFTQNDSSISNNKTKSFHILNCGSLESIEISTGSFSDFGGEFELTNLPYLYSISIGKSNYYYLRNSQNFCYSSFVIRGIDVI